MDPEDWLKEKLSGREETHHKVEDHVPDLLPDLGRDVQPELDEGGEELLDLVDESLVAHQVRASRRTPRLRAATHAHKPVQNGGMTFKWDDMEEKLNEMDDRLEDDI